MKRRKNGRADVLAQLRIMKLTTWFGAFFPWKEKGKNRWSPFTVNQDKLERRLKLDGVPLSKVSRWLKKVFGEQKKNTRMAVKLPEPPPNLNLGDLRAVQDCSAAAVSLLGLLELSDRNLGKTVLGTVLSGFVVRQIRAVIPAFRGHVYFDCDDPLLLQMLETVLNACIGCHEFRGKGKRCRFTLSRTPIVDCRLAKAAPVDYSCLTVSRKGRDLAYLPVPYTDSVALVIGSKGKLHEALSPLLSDAGVFFCGYTAPKDVRPIHFSGLGEDDAAILEKIRANFATIPSLLYHFKEWFEEKLARDRGTLTRNSSFVLGSADPQAAQTSVFAEVTEFFIAFLQRNELLRTDEVEHYLLRLRDDPTVDKGRSITDPEVFLKVIRDHLKTHPGSAVTQPLTTKDAKSGVICRWEDIGQGEKRARYLLFDQDTLKEHLPRIAEESGGISPDCFESPRWFEDLKDALAKCKVSKAESGQNYYRRDLYGNGRNTKVVAIAETTLYPPQTVEGGDP